MTGSPRLTQVLATLAALVVVQPARAQARGHTPRDSAVAWAVPTITAGSTIRVALLRERWTGPYRGFRGDTLFLGPADAPPMAIRFNAVDTLWRRERAWRRGALVGGMIGAALGAVTMGGIAADGRHQGDVPLAVLVGAAGGGVSGAMYGIAIGSLFRAWYRVYP